jgi:nitrate/TMAO reductase-like tetraheme cytochrome c subunit
MHPPTGVIALLLKQGLQDSLRADSLRTDSIAVASPLPSPALQVVRFLFNAVPQWVQIGGAILAAIVALILVFLAWRHRVPIAAWFAAKSRAWKMGFAAITLVALGGIGFAGTWSWNYMMHDNEFCSGCHIMGEPFQRFGTSEHSKLKCHDCHRQSIFASSVELYVQVTERPDKIPAHRTVPNAICSECHIQRDPDSTWKRISATAGHQVHLNPKSPVMSKLECTTCHAREVHRFKPVSETCAQSGCHDDIKVELGKMAQQTDLHCTVCHEFTVKATEGNPIDSSRAALTPGDQQCLGCHAMQERLGKFVPDKEPHGGKCGTCHNPHVQTTPNGAFQSCATSGCHARSDTLTAMHRQLGRHQLQTCGACHGAHTWKADAVDCRSCHTGIKDPAVRTRPPHDPEPAGDGRDIVGRSPHRDRDALVLIPASWSGSRQAGVALSPLPAGRARWRDDSRQQEAKFEHTRHESLTCTTCHATQSGHGTLKTSVARDCQGCHHGTRPFATECARCHTRNEIGAARRVAVPFALSVWQQPRSRPGSFAHERHSAIACADCHDETRNRAVERTCASCHADHHTPARDCAACHPPARAQHSVAVHATGCTTSGCHDRERGAAVTPSRATCLACHGEQRDHKLGRECATCHLSAWTGSSSGRGP